MSTAILPLAKIRCDGGTQPREAIDEAVVAEYAERLADGDEFPPVTVFYDGSAYWLADGFHRIAAHEDAGREQIAADVRQGTRRDAVLHSVGANGAHGLPRTNADKRRAVVVLLNDEEWGGWSDREIARRCRVGHPFVAKVRAEVIPESDSSIGRTFVHPKTGTPTQMNVSGIREAAESKVEQARRQREASVPSGYTAAFPEEDPERTPTPRAVVQPRQYTARMKNFVVAAIDVSRATDEEIAGIPANDLMLQTLRATRDVLDRIIAHHSKERKHG